MSKKKETARLIGVKLMLAQKWERRAKNVRSKPERALLFRRAKKYRQQAAYLGRQT